MLTDAQTPFLGTPLVPLRSLPHRLASPLPYGQLPSPLGETSHMICAPSRRKVAQTKCFLFTGAIFFRFFNILFLFISNGTWCSQVRGHGSVVQAELWAGARGRLCFPLSLQHGFERSWCCGLVDRRMRTNKGRPLAERNNKFGWGDGGSGEAAAAAKESKMAVRRSELVICSQMVK